MDTLSWYRLKSVPGIGNCLFKRLIDSLGTPEQVFSANDNELLSVDGINKRHISSIRNFKLSDQLKEEYDFSKSSGFRLITMSDPAYPALLKHIPDPPPIIYALGAIETINDPIAIVGSRSATDYGLSNAERISRELSSMGITIVSGMARGIDTAAHRGALSSGGKTVAVLGSGLCNIYPPENKSLFYKIAENGAVISEFPLTTKPEPHNFPLRNRIICGMSLGTVVVEAAQRSGSLITARLAGEQGREVFAIPGSIRSGKSAGTHTLIKQGAKLVENAADVLEEIVNQVSPNIRFGNNETTEPKTDIPVLEDEAAKVYKLLGTYPVHIDDLNRKLKMDSGKISSILLRLELLGVAKQSPGKLFSISED